jgi:S-adenosylmethionine:diacylglycerol 3-amino-3-carboxypropyl transferase
MSINLPISESKGNVSTKQFFDTFYTKQVSFPAGEIDATVAFFIKRGFDQSSAMSTAITLLNQSRLENVPVFSLLDTLKSLTDMQLSQVVAQIVNSYRENTSLLGYRVAPVTDQFESRNILV